VGIFLHSYRNYPLDVWHFSTIRHYHICDRSGRLGDRVGCTLRFQTDPLPNILSVDMPRSLSGENSLLISSPFPTVQTCTVVSRTCPKIESVRSALWGKTGRPAGNLQCFCPKFAYALGPACIVSGLRWNTWEEFRTSDLDLSQTGVCPGDLFFTPQRNKPNSYSSYKTKEPE